MGRMGAPLALMMFLAACDGGGNPLTGGGGGGGGDDGARPCTGDLVCGGEVNRFSYDADDDVVRINNLPFDLNGTYERDASLDRGGFRGYRNSSGSEDYVALFSADMAEHVQAAAVATDGYINFGYGGTVYTADSSSLPTRGEATFEGAYAGLRVYSGGNVAMGSSTGVVQMRMDFDDFDVVGAVDVVIVDRQAWDADGNLIGDLPYLSGSTTQLDGNKVKQTTVTEVNDDATTGGQGTLEGIVGGNVREGEGEVAGVVVITSADEASGLEVMERGIFIAQQTGYQD